MTTWKLIRKLPKVPGKRRTFLKSLSVGSWHSTGIIIDVPASNGVLGFLLRVFVRTLKIATRGLVPFLVRIEPSPGPVIKRLEPVEKVTKEK